MDDRIVLVVILILLVILTIVGIKRRWITRPRGRFTAMTVFHDWSSEPVQKGIEVIVERNAKKKEEEESSGEPDFEDMIRNMNTTEIRKDADSQ